MLVFTSRANFSSTTGATSYATTAFTPSADAGIVVMVFNSKASAPDLGSLSSPSWLSGAWTQELDLSHAANDAMRMTIFSGRTISSPGSAALTASFGGTQTGCIIMVVDVTDEDATDFVLQPKITQSATVGDSPTQTLDNALAAATSAHLGFIGIAANSVIDPGGGETEIGVDVGHNSPTRRGEMQFEINDTTTTFSGAWVGTAHWIIGSLEIKEVPAEAVPRHPAINHQNPALLMQGWRRSLSGLWLRPKLWTPEGTLA